MSKRGASTPVSCSAKVPRCSFVNDDDFESLQAGYQPKTTLRSTDWAVNVYLAWEAERNAEHQEQVPKDLLHGKNLQELAKWWGRFAVEVRKEDGNHYPPKTLQLLLCGLQRYVKTTHRIQVNYMRDPEFLCLRNTLDAYYRKLHKNGIGCATKKTELLTREDEEKLWQTGVLNPDTPQGLLKCVFFLNGRNFCLRGGAEHRDLKLSQLKREVVQVNGTAKVCYTYIEYVSKNRSGGLKQLKMENKIVRQYESERIDRCHVLLLDKYIQHLPSEAKKKDVFYMKPKSATPEDPNAPWYYSVPIGRNVLATMMKKMGEEAGLQKGVTNHSLRAYSATEMFQSNVPEKLVQQRTGHRSVEALRKYERVGEEQVVEVCRVLDGTTSAQKQQALAIQEQLQPAPQQALGIQQQLQPVPQQALAIQEQLQPAPHQALVIEQQFQPTMQQALAIQQQLQSTLQQALAIQQQPRAPPAVQHTTPHFSGCTFTNCTFSIPVPQPDHEETAVDYSSNIDINDFLQF